MKKRYMATIFGLTILIWLVVSIWSYVEEPVHFDKLNCLYVLFTGLAFAGLVVSISIQTKQLNSNARMNAISSILSNRKEIASLVSNSPRAHKFDLTTDTITDKSIELYEELLSLLENDSN
ncbi:hypothetical protein EHQ68_06795 [Leptospira congkakensis]|nr:hypothetical protein EHQ68_06795 [Leptospira congkakensis]TGL95828.1 hypothetical protein EHQ70_12035 [Leptospira congkakensis]